MISGKEILKRLGTDIKIEPFSKERLNPNSYNLRLGNKLLVYDSNELDMKKDNPCHEILIPEEGFVLEPGKIYLGQTMEWTETKNLVPMLSGRSSVGRLGISIHATAGFGDVGFKGYWTLELFACQPVRIYAGSEICQIYYDELTGEYEEYRGKYYGNDGVQASRMYRDFSEAKE